MTDDWWGETATLLSFDTATAHGSAALRHEGSVMTRDLGPARGFGAGLTPALQELLGEASLGFGDLDAVLVGSGPGSFTGVRVAAATAKGLVHALDIPLYAYSSLAAGARYGPWPDSGSRGVLFDARADRLYWAVSGPTPDTGFLMAPRAGDLKDVLALAETDAELPTLGGDGAERHAAVLKAAGFSVLVGAGVPTALALMELFAADPDPRPVADPRRWGPTYLRAWSGSK